MESQLNELKGILVALGLPESLATQEMLTLFAVQNGYRSQVSNDEGEDVDNPLTMLDVAKAGIVEHIHKTLRKAGRKQAIAMSDQSLESKLS